MTSDPLPAIAAGRLVAHRLVGEPFASPVEAIRTFGAMQSQDLRAAKWAVGLRSDATEDEIDTLCDDGAVLRTHVLRPTWHLVLPEDAGWLLELTGPRVRAGLRGRHREIGLDEAGIARAHAAFREALSGGRHLTRTELGDVLEGAGIETDAPRLTHLVLTAELDRVVISGRRRDGRPTYALFAERVPPWSPVDRVAAVTELARRYFRSHGPAQLLDFVWWSGLTMAMARAAVVAAGSALDRCVIDGRELWLDARRAPLTGSAGIVHLIPNFDEYTVGYRDRSAIVEAAQPFDSDFFSLGSVLSNVVIVGGQVRGRWRRTESRRGIGVEVVMLAPSHPAELSAIGEAVRRFERYLGCPVELSIRC